MDNETSEQKNYAARAREAVTLVFVCEGEDARAWYFDILIDGESIQPRKGFYPEGTETTKHFFSALHDALDTARSVYAYMLGKQGLSQEDFDSVLIGMKPVPNQPEEGTPLADLFAYHSRNQAPPLIPEGTIFAGSGEQWTVYEFPPSDPQTVYDEATDADADLAGDEVANE